MRPQQNYNSSPSISQPENKNQIANKAGYASTECQKRVRETPNGKLVEANLLVFTDTQANKFDLYSSKARLNEAQKKSLKQFLSEVMSCRSIRLEGAKGTAYYPILQKDYASKDAIYTKMISGQLTIGDANNAIKQINLNTSEEFKKLNPQAVKPQAPAGPGNVIGQTFDSQANGNIYLYDGPCKLPNYSSNYPLRWDAKRADNGAFIGEGCYTVNQQQVTMIATTGLTVSRPMSVFQGGGNKSIFQSFGEGLQRATTYWNNSAAETQRNTTNLTPGMTGGGGMNCTPDGRGGYNCR